MPTITFDTLQAVTQLEAAGMDSRQAKAVVATMALAFTDSVATKADLKAEVAGLKAEVFRALRIQGAGIVGLVAVLTKLL